jgi:hypothetical protein
MNPTHLHLVLNHVVIMAALFSAVLFLFGVFRKNETIKNIALFGFVISAISAIPVFLTGEPAEESVEHLAGVFESTIEAHEDAAEFSLWMIEIAGIAALGSLVLKKIQFFKSSIFTMAFVIISLISTAAISYTGYLGGQIRHGEISGNAGLQNPSGIEQGESGNDRD